MKNLKLVVLFTTIIMVLAIAGCPDEDTPARVIVQAPCPPADLELTIDGVKNNGKAGTFWSIEISYTVKCAGEGVAATLYAKLHGFSWKVAGTDNNGKGTATFAPSSDPTGDEITLEIYASNDSENPAQTKTATVP